MTENTTIKQVMTIDRPTKLPSQRLWQELVLAAVQSSTATNPADRASDAIEVADLCWQAHKQRYGKRDRYHRGGGNGGMD